MLFHSDQNITMINLFNLLNIINSYQRGSDSWVKIDLVVQEYEEKYGKSAIDLKSSIKMLTNKDEFFSEDEDFSNSHILEMDNFKDFNDGIVKDKDYVRIRRELRYVVEMLLFLYNNGIKS